jgi:hypothetical protein
MKLFKSILLLALSSTLSVSPANLDFRGVGSDLLMMRVSGAYG